MAGVMVQFRHEGGAPSLDEVARRFGIKEDQMDSSFGVIGTDPRENLYTVLVDESAVGAVEKALAALPPDSAVGIFSNPRIEPFGNPSAKAEN